MDRLWPGHGQTGAAIPNVTITITDKSKGTSVQVTTNESGEYLVPNLIPDVYDVKASATGFGTVENLEFRSQPTPPQRSI